MAGWERLLIVGVVAIVLFVLVVALLLRTSKVPTKAKLVIAGAVIWLLSPLDPLPDVLPVAGLLDDVAVLIAAVRYVMDQMQPSDGTLRRPPPAERLRGRQAIQATDWRLSDEAGDR